MAEVKRAGGYIDRGDGKGWVLDTTPKPPPPPEPPRPAVQRGPVKAAGWTLATAPEPAPAAASATVDGPEPQAAAPTSAPDPSTVSDPPASKVRAWAREAGVDVPARGPIPAEVIDQYRAAVGRE